MLLVLVCCASASQAAEIRGQIELEGTTKPISVALLPLEDQPLPSVKPQQRLVRLHDGGFSPSYMVALVGDQVRFVNEDPVFHFLTAPYGPQPLHAQLSNHGAGTSKTVTLSQPGTIRVFCHLHRGRYMQIDVLETPLAQMTGADGRFKFEDIAPGRWRLRIAESDGAPIYRNVEAFTSPPPIKIPLSARSVPTAPNSVADSIDALFPLGPTRP